MRIGELSERTGISLRSIRYYEEKGLISPHRMENGYRLYSESDVERIKFVQLLLDLRLSTDEIYPVFACGVFHPEQGHAECANDAVKLYQEKLDSVRNEINKLRETETQLEQLVGFWGNIEGTGAKGNKGK